jgi:ABC-type multidrug transport system permease subunit
VFPAFIANWILSVLLGIVIIVVTALFMNVYWGNLFVLAAVMLLVSLIATFIAILIFLFTRKISQANTLGYIIAFGLMVISGIMVPLAVFGDNAIFRFLTTYGTPLTLGTNAIIASGDLHGIFAGRNTALPGVPIGGSDVSVIFNIGVLAAITLVLGLITIIATRRRKI